MLKLTIILPLKILMTILKAILLWQLPILVILPNVKYGSHKKDTKEF